MHQPPSVVITPVHRRGVPCDIGAPVVSAAAGELSNVPQGTLRLLVGTAAAPVLSGSLLSGFLTAHPQRHAGPRRERCGRRLGGRGLRRRDSAGRGDRPGHERGAGHGRYPDDGARLARVLRLASHASAPRSSIRAASRSGLLPVLSAGPDVRASCAMWRSRSATGLTRGGAGAHGSAVGPRAVGTGTCHMGTGRDRLTRVAGRAGACWPRSATVRARGGRRCACQVAVKVKERGAS